MDAKPDAFAPALQFESAYYARKLFPLVERLGSEFEDEWRLQVKDVGLFFKQLTGFLETAFGRNSTERRFPKLPAHLLRDTSIHGSVLFILKTYHTYLKDKGIGPIDFENTACREQNLQFLSHLRRTLLECGWMKIPVVYVDPTTGQSREELEAIVHSLGGRVSSSPNDPSITHMVYPFGPEGDPDDGVQYLRSLETRPGEFFVHYWYYPDSYDNWMPADVAPENLEPDRKPIGPWKIYTRWLTDSQKFNEWMNPIDYETEEFQDEQEVLQEQQDQGEDTKTIDEEEEEEEEESNGLNSDEDVDSVMTDDKTQHKRKRDALNEFLISTTPPAAETNAVDSVRRLRSDSHRPEVDETAAVKVAPNVTKHKPLDVSKDAFSGAVENISHCVECPKMEVDCETELDDDVEYHKQLYTVPAHAAWFDWDSVHPIEQEGVPLRRGDEDGVDPDFYQKCRNTMIDKFREKSHRRLSFSDIRRKLSGNVDEMKRIYDFLMKWGLINYFPASSSHVAKKAKGAVDDGISVSVPSSAPPLIHFSNSVTLPEMDAAVTHGNELAFSLLNKPNKYGKTVTDANSQPGAIRCSAMPWIECTDTYYHCITQADIDLCQQAYSEGRFPPGTSAKDYIKVNALASAKTDANGWTDQETLLLLEAIEMYKDDWAEIAEHVATKSQLQCAMHWLTMSIEDDFVDDVLRPTEQGAFQASDEDFMKRLPFADARNPVMAQIAFLAAMVSPEVAGAAAQEALSYLSQQDGEMMDGQTQPLSSSTLPQSTAGMSIDTMRRAAVEGLKSATIKAKLLAEQEEREIQRLMNTVLHSQIKKIEIKLNYCAEQDKALDDERSRLQCVRQRVQPDRLQFRPASNSQADTSAEDTDIRSPTDNGVSEQQGHT